MERYDSETADGPETADRAESSGASVSVAVCRTMRSLPGLSRSSRVRDQHRAWTKRRRAMQTRKEDSLAMFFFRVDLCILRRSDELTRFWYS